MAKLPFRVLVSFAQFWKYVTCFTDLGLIQSMKNGKWQVNMGSAIHGRAIGFWGYGKTVCVYYDGV
jgi:hypothetical protein